VADYHTIRAELSAYGRSLEQRPQILALNKIDALDEELQAHFLAEFAALTRDPIFTISAATRQGLDTLLRQIWDWLDEMAVQRQLLEAAEAAAVAPSLPPLDLFVPGQ